MEKLTPNPVKPKFEKTYCSNCGREFGPGNHGYSHCENHLHLQSINSTGVPMDHRRALQLLSEAQVYAPSVVPGLGQGGFYIFSAAKVLGHGETIEDAFADAKARDNIPDLPPRPTFFAEGKTVLRRGEVVATCVSRTLAARIANALNLYNPNERGF
jgi:hypothetical protein